MAGKFDAGFHQFNLPSSALHEREPSLQEQLDKPHQNDRNAFNLCIQAGLSATSRQDASRYFEQALEIQRRLPDRYSDNANGQKMKQDLVALKKHSLELPDMEPKITENPDTQLAQAETGAHSVPDLDQWYQDNKKDFLKDGVADRYEASPPNLRQVEAKPRPAKKAATLAQRSGKPAAKAENDTPSVSLVRSSGQDAISKLGERADQTTAYVRAQKAENPVAYIRNINMLGDVIASLDDQIKNLGEGVVGNYLQGKRDKLYGEVGKQIRSLYNNHSLPEVLDALKQVQRSNLVSEAEYYQRPTVDELNPNRKPSPV